MQHRENTFLGTDNVTLYYQSWHPPMRSSAIVVLVHGLGAHSGWFPNVVRTLVESGYAVYAVDLRGHGRSAGQRGYINCWEEFRRDLRTFLELIAPQTPNLPVFLLGHSMGGAVVLDYVLRDPRGLQGAILMAPALKHVGITPWRLGLGFILSAIYPRFAVDAGLESGARDLELLEAYERDPLRHTTGTARLITEFFHTINWLERHISELKIPLLILHGDADRIAFPETSRRLFDRITFPDKTRYEYPGLCHELHNDFDYPHVLSDLLDWLAKHLQQSVSNPLRSRTR